MRTFTGYRPNPPADYRAKGVAAAPGEPQYEGVVFTDGTVVVRWQTDYRSHSVWACWDDFWHVHGHPEYGTRIVWSGDSESDEDGCRVCGLPLAGHGVTGHEWSRGEAVTPLPEVRHMIESVEGAGPFVRVTCSCGTAEVVPNSQVEAWMAGHVRPPLPATWGELIEQAPMRVDVDLMLGDPRWTLPGWAATDTDS